MSKTFMRTAFGFLLLILFNLIVTEAYFPGVVLEITIIILIGLTFAWLWYTGKEAD